MKRGKSADFALTRAQIPKVLASCIDLTDRVIIGLQIFLGLRISAVVHFNATWITPQGDFKIPDLMKCNCNSCAKHYKHPGFWKDKTAAGARTLPIPKRMRKDIAMLLKVKPHGLSMTRIAAYYRTKAVLRRAGVKFKGTAKNTGFPHCLRATCASLLVEGGMEAVGLCVFMGWSDINMAKVYVQMFQVQPKAMQEAREIFG